MLHSMDGLHGFEAIQDDMVLLTSFHVTLLLSLELPLNILIGELLYVLVYTLTILIYNVYLFRASGLLKVARDLIAHTSKSSLDFLLENNSKHSISLSLKTFPKRS